VQIERAMLPDRREFGQEIDELIATKTARNDLSSVML
jgi:hypothetical protein